MRYLVLALIAAALPCFVGAQEQSKDPTVPGDKLIAHIVAAKLAEQSAALRKEIREEMEREHAKTEALRKDYEARIAKLQAELEAARHGSLSVSASRGDIVVPALPKTDFRIAGRVVRHDEQGGVVLDLGKSGIIMRKTGDSFVAGGVLFKVDAVSVNGVKLTVQQSILVD